MTACQRAFIEWSDWADGRSACDIRRRLAMLPFRYVKAELCGEKAALSDALRKLEESPEKE